ncbi:MAG: hypothetical protein Q8M31_03495 [Beijerinckiaceae bacterium]|nr:hypothetical protein [Beijerinckiaceae bacterium]
MATRIVLGASMASTMLVAMPEPARADAFLEKPGEGKIILLSTFDRADQYWTRDGRLIPISAYSKFSLSAFTEYGVDANTTMIGRAEIGRLDDVSGIEAQGAGAIGVRRLLFDGGALRVAAQAVVSAGAGLEGMPFRATGAALDVRLAIARTFSLAQRSAFIEVSAGPRVVTGDGRGLRLDATFGLKPAEKWLLLFQSFNRFNEAGPFGDRTRAHKLQASVIYDVAEKWSLIGGVFTTVAARAERRQQGLLAGAQRRF